MDMQYRPRRAILGALLLLSELCGCRSAAAPAPTSAVAPRLIEAKQTAVEATNQILPVQIRPVSHAEEVSADANVIATSTDPPPLPPPAQTQSFAQSSDEKWTVDQLEAIAVANNPTIRQASAAIEQQRGDFIQAGLYPNPQVGYLRTDSSKTGQPQSNSIFVSQSFVTAHKIEKAQAWEAREVEKLRHDYDSQEMRVVNDVRSRYYEVLAAQEAVALAQDLLKLAEEGVRLSEQLVKAQTGTRSDVLEAKLQLEAIRVSLDEAEHRHRASWNQLTAIVGIPDLKEVPVAGRMEDDLPAVDLNERWRRLLDESPQLRAADADIEFSRAEIRLQQAVPVPNLNVQTVIGYDNTAQATDISTLLSLPLPVFDRNQGNIYHAVSQLRMSLAEKERIQLALKDQLSDSFRRYQDALSRVERIKTVILPYAKENLDLVVKGQQAGEFPLLRVLQARKTYFESRVAFVEALAEFHKAYIEIEGLQLSGGLNPAAVGTALQIQAGGVMQRRGILNQLQQQGMTGQTLPGVIQGVTP